MRHLIDRVQSWLIPSEYSWVPPIDVDLGNNRNLLKGKVLNAGAGVRDIRHLIDGQLVNQDIAWEDDKRTNIDIYAPINNIPVPASEFDTVVCIAVLEHVRNPNEAMHELHRVLKPGGHLILEIPFMQPEHKVPTDYQRYTRDGIIELAQRNGFNVVATKGLFNVYHTLYWQVHIWLHLKSTIIYRILRMLLLWPLLLRARRSQTYSDRLASGFQLIALKK